MKTSNDRLNFSQSSTISFSTQKANMNPLQFLYTLLFSISFSRPAFAIPQVGFAETRPAGPPKAAPNPAPPPLNACIRILSEPNFKGNNLTICYEHPACISVSSANCICASASTFKKYPDIPKIQSIRTTSFGTWNCDLFDEVDCNIGSYSSKECRLPNKLKKITMEQDMDYTKGKFWPVEGFGYG